MTTVNTKTHKDQCYYGSGILLGENPSYKNGAKHGIEKQYYKSGALMWETLYVNGVQHSARKFYYFGNSAKRMVAIWQKDDALMAPMENFL